MNQSISGVWQRVLGTQPDPPRWLVLGCAAVALLAILPHPVWRVSRNVVTIAHEGGHGLIALLTGQPSWTASGCTRTPRA